MLKISFTIPLVAAFGLALAACDQQPASDTGQAPADPQSQQQSAVPSDSETASEEKTE